MSSIKKIIGRQIFDSRGNPTVEADVHLDDGSIGRAAVPSGASTGANEAHELRDGSSQFFGKGVLNAVSNINGVINDGLKGLAVTNQELVDITMINIDDTDNKSNLGANAILAVSMAAARAAANSNSLSLYQYLCDGNDFILPVPMMNLINGGVHANNSLDIQEFMIMPVSADSMSQAVRIGAEIFHTLRDLLSEDGHNTNVGDEGGVAPNLKSTEEAISYLSKAVEKAGYKLEEDIVFAIDAASSEFYKDGLYKLTSLNKSLDSDKMINFWEKLITNVPIFSIEDPLSENDWDSWRALTESIGQKVQLVGDDLFVTNTKIFEKGISFDVANAILIKVNQIGTITEAMQAINMAKESKYSFIISHRSGETEDTFISDLSVATQSCQIKTGSLTRSDRVGKYNQLIRIEEELAGRSVYAGKSILK
ncbi:MAG: phosphopyruvate hydratase [Rhodobiaceae bacterium]|jgi:enolase|nr:phosphopyruvate hydratase [Rhodobiaceae bacterium]|tara:strand:- start:5179 stop:6450 length:1272 start_codon:yes stop_codon:yes gene_type:complete